MREKEGRNVNSQTSCSSHSEEIARYWAWKKVTEQPFHSKRSYTKDKMEGFEVARSRGELKIEDILRMNSFSFETEYIFPDLVSSSGRPLRFDFAVFDDDGNVDFLIEYQGEQHYASVAHFGGKKHLFQQKYNDNKKRVYCAQKDIPLVAIPYWEYDNLNLEMLLPY